MNDLQTAIDWLLLQLRTIGAAVLAFWEAAVPRAAPALNAARDWIIVHLQSVADWAGPTIRAGSEAVRPYLAAAIAAVAPHWQEIALAAAGAAALGGLTLWALRSLRRRRRLEASLVEATFERDPKTDWLELGIVVRNLQPQALLVRRIEVIEPPGTKICEGWQAWRPGAAGVKFVAPELKLTNVVPIERTVLPFGSVNYVAFGASSPQRQQPESARVIADEHGASPRDELIRRFYILPPPARSQQTALCARLICELQTRRGRRQELAFRRPLPSAAPPPSPQHGNDAALLDDEHSARYGAPETVATL